MSEVAAVADGRVEKGGTASSEGRQGRRFPEGLEKGLPNRWYPILRSTELRERPLRVKRFAEDLCVWRDGAGHAHVVQDRCPHRGASLSLGQVKGNNLSCQYHGWTFDGSGTCIDIPMAEALGDRLSGLKKRACLKSYPCTDRAGYIWTFYGEAAKATPLTVVPYELEDPRWSLFQQEYVWNTSWMNILDNVLDPLHALFVHVGVATQRRRASFTSFAVSEDFEEGFRLAKMGILPNGQMGQEAPVEFLLPATFRLDLADGSPRGVMRVVMMMTPVDENSSYLCYIQGRRVAGAARLWWHLEWWAKYRRAQDIIKSQDTRVLSSLGPIHESRQRELLVQSDLGVVHLRRRLTRAFTQSAGQEVEGDGAASRQGARAREPFAAWERESRP